MNKTNTGAELNVTNEELANAIVMWNNMEQTDRAKYIDRMPMKIFKSRNSQIMMVWIASELKKVI